MQHFEMLFIDKDWNRRKHYLRELVNEAKPNIIDANRVFIVQENLPQYELMEQDVLIQYNDKRCKLERNPNQTYLITELLRWPKWFKELKKP